MLLVHCEIIVTESMPVLFYYLRLANMKMQGTSWFCNMKFHHHVQEQLVFTTENTKKPLKPFRKSPSLIGQLMKLP